MVLEFSGLLHLIIVVFVTISVVGSRATTLAKTLWVLGVFFFPIIGFIVWLLAGPRRMR
ncbi:MAG: PLDc N-terminal domain-containing protein [Rhodobacteraceae bacterium]|nr:PLDc N-terminal domain-containing protein [Paracoccaceae bacterium]